jgi:hypothetical protein
MFVRAYTSSRVHDVAGRGPLALKPGRPVVQGEHNARGGGEEWWEGTTERGTQNTRHETRGAWVRCRGTTVNGGISAYAELPDALAIRRAPPDLRWRCALLWEARAPVQSRLSVRVSHTLNVLLYSPAVIHTGSM